jgi:hypothetical protein
VHATLDRIALYTWSERRQARLFRIVAERRLAAAPSEPADPADRSRPEPSTREP